MLHKSKPVHYEKNKLLNVDKRGNLSSYNSGYLKAELRILILIGHSNGIVIANTFTCLMMFLPRFILRNNWRFEDTKDNEIKVLSSFQLSKFIFELFLVN